MPGLDLSKFSPVLKDVTLARKGIPKTAINSMLGKKKLKHNLDKKNPQTLSGFLKLQFKGGKDK